MRYEKARGQADRKVGLSRCAPVQVKVEYSLGLKYNGFCWGTDWAGGEMPELPADCAATSILIELCCSCCCGIVAACRALPDRGWVL